MNDEPDRSAGAETDCDQVAAAGPDGRTYTDEELQRILEAHKAWLNAGRIGPGRADLEEANLQRADLREANLQGANLNRARLWGADLVAADLQWAHLKGANLEFAQLQFAILQGANLKGARLRGVNLVGANLLQADLGDAEFQGANLLRANLKGAGLNWAKLQAADLREANLQGASLWHAKLQGADLTGANLEAQEATEDGTVTKDLPAANLTNAQLYETNLSDAKLSGVTGLLADKLAGANLSNAKLPPDIAKFETLGHVGEISKHARVLFLAMLAACAYTWLTIATTRDLALITNTASTPLPVINAPIPIAGFYWAAPLILLGVFLYLHLYLQRLWEGLASLPAIFPDGYPVDRKAYPWLLTGLVYAFVPLLVDRRPHLWRLQVLFSVICAWCLVPFTIALLWFRYLPRHEWFGTLLLITALVIAIWIAIACYRRMRATLRRVSLDHAFSDYPSDSMAAAGAMGVVMLLFLTVAASYGAIDGRDESRVFGYKMYASLSEQDVSTKPANWTGIAERAKDELNEADLKKAEDELALVKGVDLGGANLRFANAERAFLAKADLGGANFQGANLWGANLQGANLFDAQLQGADLRRANLQGASLGIANLEGASLGVANLEGANLGVASLQGANFWRANLEGANLLSADLQGADLGGANLQGANLSLANLQGASLLDADLQGAELLVANLQGAILGGANLEGADITESAMTFASPRSTHGISYWQVQQACGEPETPLPPGWKIEPCPERDN